ncbi:hypothetical protein K1719_038484 [Acacia pycnantha]|nr:hypothetical protein K1719_038484 [Acacia pycnantha]
MDVDFLRLTSLRSLLGFIRMMGLRSWLHSHNGATNGPPFSIQSLCHCLKRCLVQVMLVELVAWFFLKLVLKLIFLLSLSQKGLPLRIQDVKRKEWVFRFRFWPNNNSRMYVLEGVTPCIQSMQLQAGDTALEKLGNTCLAAVQAYDAATKSIEALNAAQLKFQDIMNSPSLDAACKVYAFNDIPEHKLNAGHSVGPQQDFP